ncbi:MAG: hypothetical protein J6W11_04790 [Alphaproteobacteria bacterium]|nr:hypothetical protein [Alphaproteobacteria bacterium]
MKKSYIFILIALLTGAYLCAVEALAEDEMQNQGAWDKTKGVASDVWDGTKEVTSDVWDGTKEVASDVWEGTKTVGSDIKNGISDDLDKDKAEHSGCSSK